MLKVCILGYGGIARAHRKGYEILENAGAPVELCALCDIDPKQFEKVVTINQGGNEANAKVLNTYTDLEEMLEKEQPDIIDICLPTYLHCEYATMLLKRGFHVQCEKPMGRNLAECKKMLKVAKESGKQLMIGMCLRFDSTYLALKKLIDEAPFGKVQVAHFERLSSLPRWGFEGWFHDYERCGGVALDLHIHDVDMIRFLFGDPEKVSAQTIDSKVKCTTIASNFSYPDKIVTAIGDWGQSNTRKFEGRFRVNFERATVLTEGGAVMVYPDEGEPYALEIEKKSHMAEESLFFARTILGELENQKNKPADAAKTVELIEKLMESAELGGAQVEV